jgi:hypothetical protein
MLYLKCSLSLGILSFCPHRCLGTRPATCLNALHTCPMSLEEAASLSRLESWALKMQRGAESGQ